MTNLIVQFIKPYWLLYILGCAERGVGFKDVALAFVAHNEQQQLTCSVTHPLLFRSYVPRDVGVFGEPCPLELSLLSSLLLSFPGVNVNPPDNTSGNSVGGESLAILEKTQPCCTDVCINRAG